MKSEQTKKPLRRHVGIRWRLFVCLAAFMILFLLVIWVFQIRLLGYFYQREKFSDMEDIVADLSDYITTKDLAERVQSCAHENMLCIRVMRITGGVGTEIANADISAECVIHNLSEQRLNELYLKAKTNGGEYDHRMEFEPSYDHENDGFHVPGIRPTASVHAIHLQLLNEGDDEYVLLMDCELTPLGAVIRTLQVQFLWIAAALLITTLLFAYLLSLIITRPLANITEKARGLATGSYRADDSGKGYREVQELSEALNFAAREIEATDRLQKELIANISHDLRTPLTMIKGYSEMMRDIPGENSPENLQAIIDETTRLSELVRDLTDLSKLQSGAQKPTISVFDLTETVRDTMRRYDQLIKHEGYHIVFEGADEAYVAADRTMILQVIYNLINNAVNYTGESRRVVVREEIENGKVRLSVADDGEGIPPDRITEIWDRYYRVDKVHKRAVMGTGLGLSIVKGVLEAHQAVYGVDSALGVGSVFWFELPLAEKKDEESEETQR